MVIPAAGGGPLEDRLALISKMLEEAVELLRSTMSEVRDEAEGEHRDRSGEPGGGSNRRPR
jgi:hypothetical protein